MWTVIRRFATRRRRRRCPCTRIEYLDRALLAYSVGHLARIHPDAQLSRQIGLDVHQAHAGIARGVLKGGHIQWMCTSYAPIGTGLGRIVHVPVALVFVHQSQG